MYNYYMPRNLQSDIENLNKFLMNFNKLKNIKEQEIMLDFSSTRWFSGELFALFGALVYELIYKFDKKIYVNKISENLEKMFQANAFANVVLDMKKGKIKESSIKFFNFKEKLKEGDNNCFDEYLKTELQPKINLSKQELDYIINNLSELFINARTHGATFEIFCCGQKYPKINKLKLILVDLGIGIPTNVKNKFGNLEDSNCIKWALESGNTTKDLDKDVGGLGLDRVIDFVKKHDGDISIISHHGQYNYKNNILRNSEYYLNGTMVYIEFDYSDVSNIEMLFEHQKKFDNNIKWNF